MWSDNDTRIDLIDYSHLVGTIKSIVNNEKLIPCTIGVFGDWGSGKSSLVQMVAAEFETDKETLVIQFNGWLFEGYDDAKTALMSTILEQTLAKRTLSTKAKGIAKKLLKQIDWLKLAKYGVSHGIAYMATGGIGNAMIEMQRVASDAENKVIDKSKEALLKFSDGDYDSLIDNISNAASTEKTLQMGIREFHSDFGSLLAETSVSKLVVFIDDLDRCTPETIISTLEAIKLFLFIENSAFVISADERLIKYAVRRRFPEIPGDAAEVGRDYLEKLIQFPLRIPAMSESEIESYINLLFAELHIEDPAAFETLRKTALGNRTATDLFKSTFNSKTVGDLLPKEHLTTELQENLSLSAQVTPILATILNGNPRQCKRFLNTLLMRLSMAQFKGVTLQRKVMAKLMLLEYFKPETFRSLSILQNANEGTPPEISQIELKLTDKESDMVLPDEFQSWLTDSWLSGWFKSDPKLSEIDLRPYFFFSRDKLGTLSIESSRMSPEAQETLRQLVSESKSTNKLGLDKLSSLSGIDASSVFSTMLGKIREEENRTKRGNHIKTACEMCSVKPDLISELIAFFQSFPDSDLSAGVVPQFVQAIKGTAHESVAKSVIVDWSRSGNKRLAAAATISLKK